MTENNGTTINKLGDLMGLILYFCSGRFELLGGGAGMAWPSGKSVQRKSTQNQCRFSPSYIFKETGSSGLYFFMAH
jgi:hypothetical protein